jgi:predicted RNA-binding Zn-ribbon protein involved in translation (DUF1610 family)
MKNKIVVKNKADKAKPVETQVFTMKIGKKTLEIEAAKEDYMDMYNSITVEMALSKVEWSKMTVNCPSCGISLKPSVTEVFYACTDCGLIHDRDVAVTLETRKSKRRPQLRDPITGQIIAPD